MFSSFRILKSWQRKFSTTSKFLQQAVSDKDRPMQKGLLLGAYTGCERTDINLTPVSQKFVSESGFDIKSAVLNAQGLAEGEVRVFDNVTEDYRMVAVAGLGPEPGEDNTNNYAQREYVRNAAGAGARALQERGIDEIYVEHMSDGEAAAEGATLGVWIEQQFKEHKKQVTESKVFLYEKGDEGENKENWQKGLDKAEGQNYARLLTALPANVMTPTMFGANIVEELCPCGITVDIHDHKWIKQKGMEAFLTIAQGSCEPPVLAELKYSGGGNDHIVIVGKGCSFDSGAICLSPCEALMYQHADKAGAAVAVGLLKALCKLKVKATVTALLPLYENMPSENAVKTGSVVKSLNEQTTRILHPVHEGRVVMSDVLSYAGCLNPNQVISIATLSKSTSTAMGTGASATFTTNKKLYELLSDSGEENGDRVWSLPLYGDISLNNAKYADFGNTNPLKSGSALFGASFLKQFAPPLPVDYMHIDVYGTTSADSLFPTKYLREGFPTGRPVRTLVDYIHKLKEHEKNDN